MNYVILYCSLFFLFSCRNNASENYIGYVESCVPSGNISDATLNDLVFVRLPDSDMLGTNQDANYSDFVFVDVMIPSDWRPDSTLTAEENKAYIAFEMASHLKCCKDGNISPCYSHFEDYYGLKPYGLLHLAFIRAEFERCKNPEVCYQDDKYSHMNGSFQIHKND